MAPSAPLEPREVTYQGGVAGCAVCGGREGQLAEVVGLGKGDVWVFGKRLKNLLRDEDVRGHKRKGRGLLRLGGKNSSRSVAHRRGRHLHERRDLIRRVRLGRETLGIGESNDGLTLDVASRGKQVIKLIRVGTW